MQAHKCNLFSLLKYINSISLPISIFSELLEDRSRLLASLSDQRKECEELAKDVTLRRATIGALSQKLKVCHKLQLFHLLVI